MVTAYSRNPCLASMWYFYCSCINFLVGWRPLQGNIVTSQFSGGVKITHGWLGEEFDRREGFQRCTDVLKFQRLFLTNVTNIKMDKI